MKMFDDGIQIHMYLVVNLNRFSHLLDESMILMSFFMNQNIREYDGTPY